MREPIQNRYEFVYYFDVTNGNPNGDPDAGNMPRMDNQTGNGLVTDVCLKRKIRNYVELARMGMPDDKAKRYDIYVTEGAILNDKQQIAYEELELGDGKKAKGDARDKARDYIAARYFDVRTFGAVMDTGDFKCGQVRGPVQFTFSRSIDPIFEQDITITRMAATKADETKDANRTMGRKSIVPYGLYRLEGYISPFFAQKTGFSEEDLALVWEALLNMFEHDHSAARGKMTARKLIVFKHATLLGNAQSQMLFDLVTARQADGTQQERRPPRQFADYEIRFDPAACPADVEPLVML
ncbi:MAG: type I-C CRISPR-associated protein Cas7/Csd2 [Oscillospiraceae bacterium]|jgi:CRISPR-associated protein Csd2|nr:type I-C CRISPR-associated protein Cas7/Csd2 [Oscillospiraceae bacterium]